jgi:hypothetical protein
MHRHVTHNKTYANCAQFADAALGFLRQEFILRVRSPIVNAGLFIGGVADRPREMLLVRDFAKFTGGHPKVLHYLNHTL